MRDIRRSKSGGKRSKSRSSARSARSSASSGTSFTRRSHEDAALSATEGFHERAAGAAVGPQSLALAPYQFGRARLPRDERSDSPQGVDGRDPQDRGED